MKKILLLLIVLLGLNTVAQDKLLQVPEEMRMRPWLESEEHIIWDHSITLVFGEKVTAYRHMNIGEFTSLAYQSPAQIADSVNKLAVQENWTEEKLQSELTRYLKEAPGGRIFLYLTRYNESDANTKWYFIIVRDEHDEKVLEQQLGYQSPEMPEGDGWWNYYEILLEKKVPMPFRLYLNKNVSPHLSDFMFRIRSVNKER